MIESASKSIAYPSFTEHFRSQLFLTFEKHCCKLDHVILKATNSTHEPHIQLSALWRNKSQQQF